MAFSFLYALKGSIPTLWSTSVMTNNLATQYTKRTTPDGLTFRSFYDLDDGDSFLVSQLKSYTVRYASNTTPGEVLCSQSATTIISNLQMSVGDEMVFHIYCRSIDDGTFKVTFNGTGVTQASAMTETKNTKIIRIQCTSATTVNVLFDGI